VRRLAIAFALVLVWAFGVPVASAAATPSMTWVPERTTVTRIDHPCSKQSAADTTVRTGCYGLLTVTNGGHWELAGHSLMDRVGGSARACGSYVTWQRREFDDYDWTPWGSLGWLDGASIGMYFGYDGCGSSWSAGGLTPWCGTAWWSWTRCAGYWYGQWHDPGFGYAETAWTNQGILYGWSGGNAWTIYIRVYCNGYGGCGSWAYEQ
jgi:hypothetical protein